MAAAVYLRVSYSYNSSAVTLVCLKTRVAPLKRLTIPRLGLSAAVLLTNLVKHVQQTLNLSEVPVFLWTDSSVTLAWVKNNPMRWKEFVGNRVSAIHEDLPNAHWKFTSGKLNPADCASRGLNGSQLIEHSLWWNGPPWLSQLPEFWPSAVPSTPQCDLEERSAMSFSVTAQPTLGDFIDLSQVKNFNKGLTKFLRITALCQRATSCFKKVPNSSLGISPLNPAHLGTSKLFWIQATQKAYFSSEIRTIQAGKQLHKRHALSRLTPKVDHAGILRVGVVSKILSLTKTAST